MEGRGRGKSKVDAKGDLTRSVRRTAATCCHSNNNSRAKVTTSRELISTLGRTCVTTCTEGSNNSLSAIGGRLTRFNKERPAAGRVYRTTVTLTNGRTGRSTKIVSHVFGLRTTSLTRRCTPTLIETFSERHTRGTSHNITMDTGSGTEQAGVEED